MAFFTSIAAAFTTAGAWFAGLSALGQFAVQMGVSLALNALSSAIAGQDRPKAPGIAGEVRQGADVPRSFILGRYATRGSLVYRNAWGKPGDTPNEFYTRVTALSDLPIKGLAEVWIDGRRCTLDLANPHPDGRGYPVVELEVTRDSTTLTRSGDQVQIADSQELKGRAWVKFYDGTQTAADPFLVGEVASAERPWTAAEIGTGVAYAITTFDFDRELFQGFPDLLFVLDGIEILDPDTGQTGTADDIPAAQAYAILSGITYGGAWLYGPQGGGAGRVRADEWAAPVAACKAPVPGAPASAAERQAMFGSDTVPARYRSGYEVQVDQQPADVLGDLLAACAGRLAEVGTRYQMQVGDPAAAALTITDADIISTQGQEFVPFLGIAESVNGVSATYMEPAEGWAVQNAPPYYSAAHEAEDGGRRLLTDVSLAAVPYREQVQRLVASVLREARRARRHSFTLPPRFVDLLPLDHVAWDSARNGYVGKLMRVDGVVPLPDGNVQVDLSEVDPADYGWTATADYQAVTAGSVLPAVVPAETVAGFKANAISARDGAGGKRRAGVQLEWVGREVEGARGLAWQIRLAADGSLAADGVAANIEAGATVIWDGILPKEAYEARARYLVRGRRSPWTGWAAVTADDTGFAAADLGANAWDEIQERARQVSDGLIGDFALAEIEPIKSELERQGVDLELRRTAAVDAAAATDLIAERLVQLQILADRTDGRLAGAGIYVDPDTGEVKIEAFQRAETRISDTEIRLDAADAEISLRATYAEMNQAISEAMLDPTQIPVVDDLQLRITNVETDLDAIEGTISAKADTTTVDGLDLRVVTAEQEIDGLQGQISQKVEIADFTPLETRVTTAEQDLAALDGASIRQAVVDTRSLSDADALAEVQSLADLIQAYKADTGARADLAYAQEEITALVNDTREAEAAARVQLGVAIDAAEALIEAEKLVRASETEALAQDVTALQSDLATAEGDISGTATAVSNLTTRVTSAEGSIASQSQSITTLQSDLATAEDDIAATASAVTNLTTRVTSAEGSIASQSQSITTLQSDLDAAESDVSANASAVSGLTTRVASAEGQISSQASDLTNLTSRVGANEASVQTLSDTTDGIRAQYSVTINNNGHVSGFGLVSDILDGKATSQFVVSAAAFHVAAPDGSVEQSPFYAVTQTTTIGGVQVPPGVYMGKAVIREAFIDTLEIAGEAVTVPVRSFTAGDVTVSSYTNWVTIAELTIDRRGIATDLSVSFSLDGEGNDGVCELGIFRGNDANHFRYAENVTGPGGNQVQVSFNTVDFDGGTGPTTYKVKARRMNKPNGFDRAFAIRRRYFAATQFQR